MLRTQLPLVWIACICTVASSARMSGHVLEPRPVELDVLARGEMTVASVILAADVRELAQLRRRQQAVRNRDTQHRRVFLDVQAVPQAQRPELVLGQLAGEKAPRLVAKLGDPLVDEALVVVVVSVHGLRSQGPSRQRSGAALCGQGMSGD